MWKNWHIRLKAHKKGMDNAPSDVELAAALSEDLRVRKRPVQRALVNHWFNGRREPEISQFFVLCELLSADPTYILGLDKASSTVPPKVNVRAMTKVHTKFAARNQALGDKKKQHRS